MNLIKLKNNDEIKISNKIYYFNSPNNIYIPIYTDVTFRKNDYIYKNSYLKDSISSISGYVKDVKKFKINNRYISTLQIENDYKEQSVRKKKNIKINNKEELVLRLKEFHLINLSEKIANIDNINNLIITCIDEENYSNTEFIRLFNDYQDILDTIDNIANILSVKNIILALKNTYSNSIKNVKSILGIYPNILEVLLPDLYLISNKPYLCEYFKLDIFETLTLTTNEIYDLFNILNKSKDISETLITISGNALEKSIIVNTRLYTSLSEIIKEYCKIKEENFDCYINGYLHGKKVNIEETLITKDIESVVIMKKNSEKPTECINCGACEKICPENIYVKKFYFNKLKNSKCINCGLCSYICPAKLNLKDILGDNNEK